MIIIDKPKKFSRESYSEALENICTLFADNNEVLAILEFGNLTTPGISDLDILIIFNDNSFSSQNGFENYPDHLKGIFTHGILAVCESHFHKNVKFNSLSNYKLHFGELPSIQEKLNISDDEEVQIKKQLAFEFLLMNYIDIKIQKEYNILKLRSYLQHVKGIRYDFEFLGIYDHPVLKMVAEIQSMIKNWFVNPVKDKTMIDFFHSFDKEFSLFIENLLKENPVYLPGKSSYSIAKNINLSKSENLKMNRNGILLPAAVSSILGKRYIKLLNKLNTFNFSVPIINQTDYSILEKRFDFLSDMNSYNKKHFPQFATLTSSLTNRII